MGCSVEGCESKHYCKGYCRPHYRRWCLYGDPLVTQKPGRPRRYCAVDGCEEPRRTQGLCDKHRKRLERYGDPSATKRIIGDIEARWWSYVDRRGDDECWPWTGTISDSGYGIFGAEGKTVGAHVWGYQRFVRHIPRGMQLDHVKANGCTMRNCVNYLQHLEPVTKRENVLRGSSTKLSDGQVDALLARIQAGEHFGVLAKEVGVSKSTLTRRIGMLVISRIENKTG